MGTISTAIPTPEYQPLLDAILAAADICGSPGDIPEEQDARAVGGFALAVLSRWMTNAQAFVVLRNANFLADAYGVARIGSELAIMTAWASEGGAGSRFATRAARVRALIDDGTFSTRKWLDKIHERDPTASPRYDSTTDLGRILHAATDPGLPNLKQMADCSEVTKDQYAYAYRGESGSVHSAARVLAANAAGEPPIAERLMLHNVLVAAMVTFGSVANLLDDERARQTTTRLQQAIRDRVPSTHT